MSDLTPDPNRPEASSPAPPGHQATQPPGYGGSPPPQNNPPTNGMAIASLISGILGLTLCLGLGSIAALIFGYVGKGQIDRSGGTQDGRGLAVAGIVMGWIGIALSVLGIIFFLVAGLALFGLGTAAIDELDGGELIEIPATVAGCSSVQSWPNDGVRHLRVGANHAPYSSDPPTSGPHYEVPARPGFYDRPLAPERLVHNLEHGQIVIWYRPELPAEQKTDLRQYVNGDRTLVAAPYDRVPTSANFVMTAWRKSRACEDVSDSVIDDFRRRFQGRSPEPITPPFVG